MTWQTAATLAIPVVLAITQFLLSRRLKKGDDARATAAASAEQNRRDIAEKAEKDRGEQTALLNQIKGAVEDHRSQLVAIRTRVDGHDKEFDRLYSGVFRRMDRRTAEEG